MEFPGRLVVLSSGYDLNMDCQVQSLGRELRSRKPLAWQKNQTNVYFKAIKLALHIALATSYRFWYVYIQYHLALNFLYILNFLLNIWI